jgi:hypothetical protein
VTTPQTGLYLVPKGRGTGKPRGKYETKRHEVYHGTFKIDGIPCRLIALTRGKTTIVWEVDYADLSQFSWCARRDGYTGAWYAIRTVHEGERHWEESMHRRILGLQFGDPRKGDHVEVDQTLDNRRSNLRIATHGQNRMNSRRPRNNTTGYKGVSFCKHNGMFSSRLTADGRQMHLGYFSTAILAAEAREVAALKYHGRFARKA